MVRDPRDTVVSGYFQAVKRIKVFKGSISDFIRDEKHGIEKILKFHAIWLDNKDAPKDFLLVRYEDMHKSALVVLKKTLEFLQVKNIDENKLKKVVEFAKFDNMHRLEKEGFFEKKYGSILTPSDKSDKESFKVRRGQVGGYLDYLSEKDTEYCNECMRNSRTPFY